MHDMRFAQEIIACLREKLGGRKQGGPSTVNVVLSPFTHVTEETLRAAFRELLEKEDHKDVSLAVKIGKIPVKCTGCGKDFFISKPEFTCTSCGSAGFDILNNKEFVIESVEIDHC